MKNYSIIIIVSFMLGYCFTSCNDRPRYMPELIAIDTLMDTAPDSALALICDIDTASLTNDADRALYALLRSMALYKNYIDVIDDSLISIAQDYYDESDDIHRRMLSHYYHGTVKLANKEYGAALIQFIKSEMEAKMLGCDFWRARSVQSMGNVYSDIRYYKDRLECAKLAYELFDKTESEEFALYAMVDLAHAYNANNMYEQAKKIANRVIESASVKGDETLASLGREALAFSLFNEENYTDAIPWFESYLSQNGDVKATALLGLCYVETGRIVEAIDILRQLEDLSSDNYDGIDDISLLSLRYKIAYSKGDYKNGMEAMERVMMKSDTILASNLSLGLNNILIDYYNQEQTLNETRRANERLTSVIILSFIIIAGIFGVLLFVKIYQRQQKVLNRNLAIAENLREILFQNEIRIENQRLSVREALSSHYAEVENLLKEHYNKSHSKDDRHKMSQKIASLIEGLSSDSIRLKELEIAIDASYDCVLSNLKSDFPELKTEDYFLFLYTLLGFSNTTISLLLKESKLESVYNRKARLKTKLRKSTSPRKDIYLEILS